MIKRITHFFTGHSPVPGSYTISGRIGEVGSVKIPCQNCGGHLVVKLLVEEITPVVMEHHPDDQSSVEAKR